MSEEIARVENATRVFRSGLRRDEIKAMDGMSFALKRGAVVAFVGPNGAGKTTTIYSLLGLVKTQTGSITLFGRPPGSKEVKSRIGFQSEIFHTYPFKTARQTLFFYGGLSGIPPKKLEEAVPRQLSRLGLGEAMDRKVGAFSKGMVQRLGLAQALLHEPELLLLDEPTTGLDPEGRKMVADIVNEEKARGTTIFLSSHILSDVERTCDEVLIVRQGRIAFADSMASIKSDGGSQWEVTIARWSTPVSESLAAAGFAAAHTSGETASCFCTTEQKNALLRRLLDLPVDIISVRAQRRSLEDLYMQYAGGSSGG